jgi:flavin-dependent dehydrogenase
LARPPKVAVVGAGLSGLACAIGLERRGLRPDVFEKRSVVGGRFPNVEGFMRIADAPFGDALHFLWREYGLRVWVPNPIERLVFHSVRHEAVIRGPLGYTTLRGDQEGSFEKQLAQEFKGPIHFGRAADAISLAGDYDFVVVADGQDTIPRRLGFWRKIVSVRASAWVVEGPVPPTEIDIWLDPDLAGHGYAYILPWRERTGMAAIYEPDAGEGDEIHADRQARFLEVLRRRGLQARPLEGSQINDYEIGYPERCRDGPLLFVGNAAGCIQPLAGFGQLLSVISGFAAARAIVEGRPYEAFRGSDQRRRADVALRRLVDRFGADDFDRWIAALALIPFRDLFFSTNLPLLTWGGSLVSTFWPPAGEGPSGR